MATTRRLRRRDMYKTAHTSSFGSTTVSQAVLDRLWVEAVRQQVLAETVVDAR